MSSNGIESPRLQLRWVATDNPSHWECHYELAIPLREHDIRREVWNEELEEPGDDVEELIVPMKEPTLRDGNGVPCQSLVGLYFDPPYRDGAHATWDSVALGGLPIYVIAPDGTPIAKPEKP